MGFLGDSVVKNPSAKAGAVGFIPGSERSPGEGNGNPFQYSGLENPMDRDSWRATVSGVAKKVGQHLASKQKRILVQAYLRVISSSVPGYHSKANTSRESSHTNVLVSQNYKNYVYILLLLLNCFSPVRLCATP